MTGHRMPRSPHNPACANPIAGYALFEAVSSQPLRDCEHEALLVERSGACRWEPCEFSVQGYWICPDLEDSLPWVVVGWRYIDGSWPTGPAHAIDLTLVDFERCPTPRRLHPTLSN